MNELAIGQVAREIGVRTSTIRYYESIGLIPEPPRTSGWRRYRPEILERLSVIRVASEFGFSLDEIAVLLDGFPPEVEPSQRWRAMAQAKLPEIEALIAKATTLRNLLQAGLDCDCDQIETCITSLGESCRTAGQVQDGACGSNMSGGGCSG